VTVERVRAERLDVGRELGAKLRGHAAHDADVVQLAAVVVEARKQRTHAVAVLVHAITGDHAVDRALVLHLQHRALPRLIGARDRLGDDAVEARALEPLEPVGGDVAVGGRRRQEQRRLGRAEQPLELLTTRTERRVEQ